MEKMILKDDLFLFSDYKKICFFLYDLNTFKSYYKLYSNNSCKIAFNNEKIFIDEEYLFDFFLTNNFLDRSEKTVLLKELKLAYFLREKLVIFDISKLNYYSSLI